MWVLDLGSNADGGIGAVVQYLSVIRHYEDFTRGVIDTSALIYYFSFIALFYFLDGSLGGFNALAPRLRITRK